MSRSESAPPRFPLPQRLPFADAYPGWWIAAAVGAVAFSRVAFFNPVLGVFIQPLEEEFGWSRATIAGALSAGTVLGALLSPLIGALIDRHGGRWFMVGSGLVGGLLLVLLAAIEEVWQFYVLFGAGRAIVTAVVDIAVTVTIANWFIRHRGRATGVMLLGTRGGMMAMPFVVLLFITLFDWRAAFAALGVLVWLFAVAPAWRLVRRRPEDFGLLPDGDEPRVTPSDGPARPQPADPHWTVRQAVNTRAFWLLLLGTSQLFLVGGAVNLTLTSHLQDNGLSQGTAISMVGLWAGVGILGTLLGGEIRERLSVRFALPLVIVFTASSLVWLIFVDSVWMAVIFAVWHGFAFGAQLPLNQISFPDYFGRWSIGAIRGVTAPVQFGLNAVGPIVAGLTFDARGSYDLIYAVFVGLLLFGALSIVLAAPPRWEGSPAPAPPPTRST